MDDAVDWEGFKDRSRFGVPPPVQPPTPSYPREPSQSSYRIHMSGGDRVFALFSDGIRKKRQREAHARFEHDHDRWQRRCDEIDEAAARDREAYTCAKEVWERKRVEHEKGQRQTNGAVERQKQAYLSGTSDAIVDYCDMVLAASEYPAEFPQAFALEYRPAGKLLLVEYELPSMEDMPLTKDVKFIQTRDEFKESELPATTRNKLYDSAVYQICLRTIHEMFEADAIGAIETVVFNGFVRSMDPGTGQEVSPCIVSVQASREAFEIINLAQVDPKACFKNLKGVGSSRLHGLAAIPPILTMNREDPRFTDAINLADNIDAGCNLATMDWEDFEHLVREVFEREFSSSGGEVKVTRASRDGGVDAVAFDPDPIRGGKIVIQAKRYTNTVGCPPCATSMALS